MRARVAVSGPIEQRAAMIGGFQRGRMTRAQQRQAGLTDGMIGRLVNRSLLSGRRRGIYQLAYMPAPDFADETDALLALGTTAVLSHRTAARLWDLPVAADRSNHLLTSGTASAGRGNVVVHRTNHLPSSDMRVHRGLPVTSPARLFLDLAQLATRRELERALDEALTQRMVRLPEIEKVLAGSAGRRRSVLLESLISDRPTTVTRSKAEKRFLALIRSAALPTPQVNARILGFELDCAWVEQRLVVEIDGYRFHSSRSAFERNRRRDAVLSAAGWRVMRVTWLQMEHEPLAVIARLAQALVQPA